MNYLIVSPAFPPTTAGFCAALRDRGVAVLGVGDDPPESLSPSLRASLTEYLHLPRMADYDVLRDGVAGLVARHGPLQGIDSIAERWLAEEGRLRDDFGVPGLTAAQTARQRSKTGMAEVFRGAGIACPPGMSIEGPDDVRGAAARFGLPMVIKPDTGSGATATFAVRDALGLSRAAADAPRGCIAQPFVDGDIVTFDGLADADGAVMFCTSHEYDAGIMEVLTGRLDGHYASLREIPSAFEDVGRRAVRAFDVRARFFHAEFFRRGDGSYVALEMNLRPPGGFTTDMMNLACDFDVYALWAEVVTRRHAGAVDYARRFHTAHAGRRRDRAYRVAHDDVVRALGDTLAVYRPIPPQFAATMGDDAYLLRHRDRDALREAIALVQGAA